MVRTSLLSSIIVVGICCLRAASFTFDSSNLHHVRFNHLKIEGESSVLSDSPSFARMALTEDRRLGRDEDAVAAVRDLPPVLQQITDERRNFQRNLGKAMDTLRKDMPYILKSQPDYSIYHPEITVVDPSGVQLTGLDSYKSSIKFMQQFVKFWFQERSGLQYRMVYDFARSSIRVSWHAVLVPKVPLGKPLHVDGISMYKLDVDSGKVIEHKFEKMMINNTPVMPPYGVFSLLQYEWGMASPQSGVGVPAGI
ncbi:DUF2358 domain containing protein [Nitzschia inconspicua]|uniref:DUF2358 domain containing protein n=1 Tax=Nitzschia inconspicua TaxID=303405 RepID=A0A9K3KF17_9STRA|nr:DUF2358 domain containing protein [Nitzschia inconspicua]